MLMMMLIDKIQTDILNPINNSRFRYISSKSVSYSLDDPVEVVVIEVFPEERLGYPCIVLKPFTILSDQARYR